MEQIDILMATYNGEKYLREQIDSILNQTYLNIRLIISDDCSKDQTIQILKEYEMKDKRVKVYYQKHNLGVVKNFEFLLGKVENEIYALSDQDDIWLPDKIEKSLENMKKNNSDLVFGDLILINENGELLGNSFWKNKGFDKKIKKDKNHYGLLLNNYATGCTIISKKSFIKYILPLPKESKYMIHDYWITIVVSLKGKISYDEIPHIKYRQHTNNQIGYKMKSKELGSLEEIRNMFIDVKIDHFEIFKERKELFTEEQQKINEEALKYYNMLKNKKNINFRGWKIFWKLYKYENFKYFFANFIILNFPIIGKLVYKRR